MTSPIWHPFTQHGLGHDIPEITSAKGALLYGKDGREVIDAISSWWVTTHGHCHPPIIKAIQNQAAKLDQLIFAGWTHDPAEKLAASLIDMTPSNLEHVFYSDSGSTSVEVALKMALGYWSNQGINRDRIIVMEHSYHGDTIGTMSIGERGVFNQAYNALMFDVDSIPFPAIGQEQESLNQLEQFCASGQTAAFIVEPLLLGAGGMLVYSPETLCAMHEICTRHDVIFIADEVMTGWGRTGTLLACEQANIEPDILCLSKGITGGSIPLAVTLSNTAIFDAHYSTDRSKAFFHSSSYTANPIACAAANANIALWQDSATLNNIQKLCAKQKAQLQKININKTVQNARQIGTITAFELDDSQGSYLSSLGPKLLEFFVQHNVLLRPLGNTIYVMPPYCISDEQLNRVYEVIQMAINKFTGSEANIA